MAALGPNPLYHVVQAIGASLRRPATPFIVERNNLFFETKRFNQRFVALFILALEVAQMFAAVGYHLQETTARVKIFFVGLEVLGKLINFSRQQCSLCF